MQPKTNPYMSQSRTSQPVGNANLGKSQMSMAPSMQPPYQQPSSFSNSPANQPTTALLQSSLNAPTVVNTKTSRASAFGILTICGAATIFFFIITRGNKILNDCTYLGFTSNLNLQVWYYCGLMQMFYLTLVFGMNKWNCVSFSYDLPILYRSMNIITLVATLGGLVSLQIALNKKETCGDLSDSVQVFLSIGYIMIIIFLVYLVYEHTKLNGGINNANNHNNSFVSQQQYSEDNSIVQKNYQTFNNQQNE